MLFFLASLAWSVVAAYWVWSYDRLRRAELDAARAMALQDATARQNAARAKQDSRERIAGIKAAGRMEIAKLGTPQRLPNKPSTGDIQLPDDLEAHVMTWGDEWARDDERTNIRAKFLELANGDNEQTWQRVRRAVGIGELP